MTSAYHSFIQQIFFKCLVYASQQFRFWGSRNEKVKNPPPIEFTLSEIDCTYVRYIYDTYRHKHTHIYIQTYSCVYIFMVMSATETMSLKE